MTVYSAVIAADSPLRVYACGEASGGFADTSGNAHNATPTGSGSVSYGQAAILTSEATLSAKFSQGEYASVPTTGFPSGLLSSGFAMETWLKAGTLRNGFEGIMGYGVELATQAIDIAISNVNVFYAKVNGGTAILGPTAVTNTIYHLVMSFDGTTMTFYVNGASVGTTNPTVAIVATSAAFGGFADGTSSVGWTHEYVAFYGAPLSAVRVLAHYNAGASLEMIGNAVGTGSGVGQAVELLGGNSVGSGSMAGYLSGLLSGAAVGTGSGVGQPLGFVSGVAQGAGSARGSLAGLIAAYANGTSAANGSIAALLHGSLIGAGRGRGSLVYFGSVTTTISDAPSVTTTIGDHDAIDEEIAA